MSRHPPGCQRCHRVIAHGVQLCGCPEYNLMSRLLLAKRRHRPAKQILAQRSLRPDRQGFWRDRRRDEHHMFQRHKPSPSTGGSVCLSRRVFRIASLRATVRVYHDLCRAGIRRHPGCLSQVRPQAVRTFDDAGASVVTGTQDFGPWQGAEHAAACPSATTITSASSNTCAVDNLGHPSYFWPATSIMPAFSMTSWKLVCAAPPYRSCRRHSDTSPSWLRWPLGWGRPRADVFRNGTEDRQRALSSPTKAPICLTSKYIVSKPRICPRLKTTNPSSRRRCIFASAAWVLSNTKSGFSDRMATTSFNHLGLVMKFKTVPGRLGPVRGERNDPGGAHQFQQHLVRQKAARDDTTIVPQRRNLTIDILDAVAAIGQLHLLQFDAVSRGGDDRWGNRPPAPSRTARQPR